MRLYKSVAYTLCILSTIVGCRTTSSYHECPSCYEHTVTPVAVKKKYEANTRSFDKKDNMIPMLSGYSNKKKLRVSERYYTVSAKKGGRRYVSAKQDDSSSKEERRMWKSILEAYKSKDFYTARRKSKDFEKELTYRELEQPERFDRLRWSRIVVRTALAQSYYMEGENLTALEEAEKALKLSHVDRKRYKSATRDEFNYSRLYGLVSYIFAGIGERQGAIDSLLDKAKKYGNKKASSIFILLWSKSCET